MLAFTTPSRALFALAGAALVITGGVASAASAKAPKGETVTVSSRVMKDETSKLCLPRKDPVTRKDGVMCLTREGWAAQGVTIIVK